MATWKKADEWISSEDFGDGNPISANITAVDKRDGKYGAECVLYVRIREGLPQETTKAFSVFKKNLNVLIDKFGEEDGAWIGRTITIKATQEGKKTIKDII
jgi:hypothetical protein